MGIEVLSGAATIALLGSAAFALAAWAWTALSVPFAERSHFAQGVLSESAQRFRDELERLGRTLSILLASMLVFAVLFAASWVTGAADLFAGYARWLQFGALIVVFGMLGYAAYRLADMSLRRRRLALRRAANILVGQVLQRISGNMNRVFHDVHCVKGVIDHVLVGRHGVYAIYVVARRPRRNNALRLDGTRLVFAPGTFSIPFEPCAAMSDQLAAQLRKVLRHAVHVRTVLVAPGWEIEVQANEALLVANERNLIMLRGWRDASEYLMNEDVESLDEYFSERCVRWRGSAPQA